MWLRRSGLMLAAAVVLSSCGGDIPARMPFAAPAERANGTSCATQTCIYVTGNAAQSHHPHDNKVLAYSRDADGNAPPVSSVAGTKTHLVYPRAVALDGARNLYVSNYTPLEKQSNVAIFAPGASGNTPPLRTISGPDTQLQAPSALSLDPAGNLYVIDSYGAASGCSDPTGGCWTVNVYAAGAAGDAAPVRSIRGPATKLYYAYGSAVDASGNVYVADGYHVNCCVTVYSAGASGNVKPVRTIQGSRTDLAVPVGIALDSHANVYVLNAEGSPTRSVTVYAAGAHGNVKPIRDIVGQNTGLYAAPAGIAVDGSGRVYVLQSGTSSSISVFAPGATGDVAPIRVIAGSKTGLANPWAIAVR
jgi:sugar lactone lactonase YvrE